MNDSDDQPHDERDRIDSRILADIERKLRRRLHARRRSSGAIWHGLGTMGVVGWSVAVPVLIGILSGIWLDENVPVPFSWVLTGLVIGVIVGSINAWAWISSERAKIQQRREAAQQENHEDNEHNNEGENQEEVIP